MLLIYDAYRAHISLQVLKLFHKSNLVVYVLPANTSGKTQPVDFVPFSVFKNQLNKILCSVSTVKASKELKLFDICGILCEAYNKSFTNANIVSAFRRSGIWPLDRDKLLSEELRNDSNTDARLLSV